MFSGLVVAGLSGVAVGDGGLITSLGFAGSAGLSGTFAALGGNLIGSTLKSSGLISGGRGNSERSPTGGRVLSVMGGKSGRLNCGGGGIIRGGKLVESPTPGIRPGGMAKGAVGTSKSGSGKFSRLGVSGVDN